MNYCYRIYPDASPEETMLHWLEISRKVYNYALREIKDWVNSRKCSLDYCSLEREYIIPADKPFPALLNTGMNSRFPNGYKPSRGSFVTSSKKFFIP
jgi:putative transposase